MRRGVSLVEILFILSFISFFLLFSLAPLYQLRSRFAVEARARNTAVELRSCQAKAMAKNETVSYLGTGLKFAASGFPLPGGSGTIFINGNNSYTKKVILSSAGRIRLE